MSNQINIEQLKADIDLLSPGELARKYPSIATQSLKGLSVEELEQRVSKTMSPTGPSHRPGSTRP